MALRTSVGSGLWSAVGTWNTGVPVDTDTFLIAAGHTVTFDVDQSAFAGLGASTIAATGTLIVSTTAGAYVLKMNADLTLNGTLQIGTSVVVPYPATCTFTINFSAGSNSIVAGTTGRVYSYCAQPVIYWVQNTVVEPITETVIAVDAGTDWTLWANGSDILIVDADGLDVEYNTIANTAAGILTLGVGLNSQLEIGGYIGLLSRNIKLINSTDYVILYPISSVINCEIDTTGYGIRTSGGDTFTGTTFISSSRVNYSANNVTYDHCIFAGGASLNDCYNMTVSNSLTAGGSPFYMSYGLTVNDCILNGTSIVEQAKGNVFNRCTIRGTTGTLKSYSNVFNDCVFETTTGISYAYASIFNGCTYDCTIAVSTSYQNKFIDCDFSESGTENSGYNATSSLQSFYDESINHDRIDTALKAWCRGGIVSSQTASPPSGYTIWYQLQCESATYPCFRQYVTVVQPGTAIEVTGLMRINDAADHTTYPPRLQIIDYFDDPLVDATAVVLDEDQIADPDGSDNSWQTASVIWANQGDSPRTVLVRMIAKHATGDVDTAWAVADYQDQIADIQKRVKRLSAGSEV